MRNTQTVSTQHSRGRERSQSVLPCCVQSQLIIRWSLQMCSEPLITQSVSCMLFSVLGISRWFLFQLHCCCCFFVFLCVFYHRLEYLKIQFFILEVWGACSAFIYCCGNPPSKGKEWRKTRQPCFKTFRNTPQFCSLVALLASILEVKALWMFIVNWFI